MANDAEAQELIAKLGLAGQSRLINPDTVTRLPYRAMEAREMLVYRALCDASKKLEEYDVDAIPVRILQVAATAKDCSMFTELQVWYPREARIDDPLLVGVRKAHPYPDHPEKWMREITNDTFFLLARWGKTLLPFEQLEAMAVKMHRTHRVSQLKKAIQEATLALSVAQETDDLSELSKQAQLSY